MKKLGSRIQPQIYAFIFHIMYKTHEKYTQRGKWSVREWGKLVQFFSFKLSFIFFCLSISIHPSGPITTDYPHDEIKCKKL